MPKKSTAHRFNRFSVGRAAVLYRRGMDRSQVLEHLFHTYGKQWGIKDYFEMYQYLFQKGPGDDQTSPRCSKIKPRKKFGMRFLSSDEKMYSLQAEQGLA